MLSYRNGSSVGAWDIQPQNMSLGDHPRHILNWLLRETADLGVALKSCPFVKRIYISKGNL
jgi:hypothetical protein